MDAAPTTEAHYDKRLNEFLISLDHALTGKQLPHPAMTCLAFYSRDEYYLSDGGYSRVWYSEAERTLYLASESRDEVKAAWDTAAVIRIMVESVMKHWEVFMTHQAKEAGVSLSTFGAELAAIPDDTKEG